ncbi:restriction endonuclease type II-like protein [Terfezia claveryi]|nr:restriction endonuclease type II-like protein [Terfezia claveryi]
MDDDFDDFGAADDAALTKALDEAERRAAQTKASSSSTSNRATSGAEKARGPATVQQPLPQKINRPTGTSSIIVSQRQKGNPVLTYIKNVPWEYGDIVPDYVVGKTACVLFLSLKYHRLHPEYIYNRVKLLGHSYSLRILLVMVDIENHQSPLLELSKTCHLNDLTLILSWAPAEAGRYLESYKSFENAAPTLIQEKPKADYTSRMIDVCTSVRSVSKKDAVSLVTTYGSVRAALNAEKEEIVLIQGWGEKKAERWEKAAREPFMVRKGRKVGEMPNARREDGQRLEADIRFKRGDVAGRLGIGPVTLPEAMTQGPTVVVDDDEGSIMADRELEREKWEPREKDVNGIARGGTAAVRGHDKIMAAIAKLRATG